MSVCAEQSYVMIKPDGVQRGLVRRTPTPLQDALDSHLKPAAIPHRSHWYWRRCMRILHRVGAALPAAVSLPAIVPPVRTR